MSSLSATPRRRLDARTRNVKGIVFVAGPERVFELSDVAARIVRLCDGRRTVAQIGEQLVSEYDIDGETAARDAAELLDLLAEHGVIEWEGE